MSATAPLPRDERLFPTLTPEQIGRIAAHGARGSVPKGEVLIAEGQSHLPLIVVTDGELEVVRSTRDGESWSQRTIPGSSPAR